MQGAWQQQRHLHSLLLMACDGVPETKVRMEPNCRNTQECTKNSNSSSSISISNHLAQLLLHPSSKPDCSAESSRPRRHRPHQPDPCQGLQQRLGLLSHSHMSQWATHGVGRLLGWGAWVREATNHGVYYLFLSIVERMFLLLAQHDNASSERNRNPA